MIAKFALIVIGVFKRLKVFAANNKFATAIIVSTFCFLLIRFIVSQEKVSNDTQPIINDSKDEIIMLQTIENLQDSIAVLNSKIQEIDSLRFKNARAGNDKSIHEHYSELSRRYANKKSN